MMMMMMMMMTTTITTIWLVRCLSATLLPLLSTRMHDIRKKCIYEKLLRAALSRAAVGRSTAGAMQLTSNGHCSVDGRVNASPPPQKSPFRLRVNLSNPALSPA